MRTIAPFAIAVLVFLALGDNVGATQDAFEFHSLQSVFIVAVGGNTSDPSLSAPDLAADREISEGFKKRGVSL